MKLDTIWKIEDEVKAIFNYHSDNRWAEISNKLSGIAVEDPEALVREKIIQKKHVLRMIDELKLLIKKAESDVRD